MKSVETRPGKENTRAAGLPWGHSLSLSPPRLTECVFAEGSGAVSAGCGAGRTRMFLNDRYSQGNCSEAKGKTDYKNV